MSACMYIITMWAVPMKIIQLAHRKTFVRKNYLFFFSSFDAVIIFYIVSK